MSQLKESQHLHIPLKDIEIATKHFEESECIGKGGYGRVYKGELLIAGKQTTVAVKRLNENLGQGLKEFLTEIQLLSGQTHPNLISLLGYCDEAKEKIIVYEYADRGSLDRYIVRKNTTQALTWLERLKICLDAALGLEFLHNHFGKHQSIIHRDVKSANILIDQNWVAKISDLGLSKLSLAGLNRSSVITHACGTPGYCEPEYIITGIVKKESDVYSFGMVLFEVLSGRLCQVIDRNGFILSAKLVKDCYKNNNLDEIVDPGLRDQMSPNSLKQFSAIAYRCLSDDRDRRPSMRVVVKELEELVRIQIKLKKEKEEQLMRKEKGDSNLYRIIKVARDDDLLKQIGKYIYFDLVDYDKVHSFRIRKHLSFTLFKEDVAIEFGIAVQYQRFWLMAQRNNQTYRLNRPLTPQEEAQPIGQLRESSKDVNNSELKLFLEVEFGQDLRPIPLPEKTGKEILLFFKLYDPLKEELRYVGRLYVKVTERPREVLARINELAGYAPDEEIELFEEFRYEPHVMCEQIDKRLTFQGSMLKDGDIICFQKPLEVEHVQACRYPDVPSFLEYVCSQQIEPLPSGNLPHGFDQNACCSVYVDNIHTQVTESLLQEVFASIGPIEGCQFIRKEKSSYGFIHYFDHRSAALAISSLNGRHLFGQPIKVNWAYASGLRVDTAGHYDIFVGNLSPEVTDASLFACFSAYPSCLDARVMWDKQTGSSRGFGFVSFRDQQHAQCAINDLTGKWLGSRQIHCNWATKGAGTSDEKQVSDSKSVVELTDGSSEDEDISKSDAPENNPLYTTAFVGNLAPKIRLKAQDLKKKENAEAHLYRIIKVACDEDLREQIGKHIYFDLVDHDKVRSFRFRKDLSFALFKEDVAMELGIAVQYQRFWLLARRQNHTYRLNRPLTPQEEAQPVGHLKESSKYDGGTELKLFLEVELGWDLRPIRLPEKTKQKILLFFKLYDPLKEDLRYVGRLFVNVTENPRHILAQLNELAGYAPDEELELFEEIKFLPNVICEHIDKSVTFRLNQLEDGDIICFQKQLRVEHSERCRYPDVPSFLEYIRNHHV